MKKNRFVSALAILGAILGVACPLMAQPLTFSNVRLAVGSGPISVIPANLNGTGHPDLVTANMGFRFGCIGDYGGDGSNLTIWVNNGKGAFTTKTTVEVGGAGLSASLQPEPASVAAADLNGDGKVELIEANFYYNTVLILTNNGKGAFNFAHTAPPTGRGPLFVTTADVNGDGKPDIITVNNYDSNISVLTNAGNFTFPASATLAAGSGPAWVTAADLNGDGNVDLVCANYGSCGSGNTLTVYFGDGHGGFTTNATLTVGGGPACVVAADVNGDGKIDLITANQNDGSLTVLTNDGLGNFTLKTNIYAFSPSCVVATDMNGDGKIDLAIANSDNGYLGSVTILTNDGVGNFSTNTIVPVGIPGNYGNYPDSMTAADFNGDGEMDLAIANYGTACLTVLTQTTARKTPPPPPVVTITTPVDGASFVRTEGFVVTATASLEVSKVELDVDGQVFGTVVSAPYDFEIAAGALSAGSHTLQAVAVDSQGVSGSSAVVHITVNKPGTVLIDFDALDTSAGAVGGVLLTDYLSGYGVSLEDVTDGSALEAVNTNSLTGSIGVEAPSSPNFFTQAGLDQPVSFTLRFASNLQSFGFTRAGLIAPSGVVSHPQWTATAFDGNGVELGSVSEGLIVSAPPVGERQFVLPGNGIASVRFDSDSQQTADFSGVLLDNLVLSYNPAPPSLSVDLSVTNPPTNDIVAPATITLAASVTDLVSLSYYVSFFSGPTLLGTVSNSPYELTLTGVLPGNYSLQARVVDASGLAAESEVMPVSVQVEPNSTVINFDALNASRGAVEGAGLNGYLAGFGVSVAGLSAGTALAVESQQNIAGGHAALASSEPNLLTEVGSSGPAEFTLSFAPLLSQFGFTRPELAANPFVSHPAWQVTALDGSGTVVGQVGEEEIDSVTDVGAREFSLSGGGGPGIAEVRFSSEGSGRTTFNGMLVDDLVLTTNKSAFPPAVGITRPISGQTLAAPPALTVAAAAWDAAGIAKVSFYADQALIGVATQSPYTIIWPNPAVGVQRLTAVALNTLGLAWTSSVVRIVIGPSADQFGISSQPVSQTVGVGSSVAFAVVTSGTNGVGYQWYYNGGPILGQTSDTLVLPPPIEDTNAGTYTVAVTANGTTITSDGAVLTVVDPPVLTTQPQGQTVPAGTMVTLGAAATGAGPLTWQWFLNGSIIPGATGSVYTIAAAEPLRSGNYQVVVANQSASALSVVAPVIVETAITVPESNDNFSNRASINPLLGPVSDSNQLATLEAGEPLPDGERGGKSIWFTWHATFTGTLSLTTEGSDFDTLLAVYTGTALRALKAVAADDDSGGYLTSLVTFNVTEGTDYQIDVDGFQGASGRVVLGLAAGTGYRTLSPASGDSVPVIARGPAGKAVAPGATVILSVQASSPTKITYQWNFQGEPIVGATGSTLMISHVGPGSVGFYDVLVANAVGSAQSEPASVQIAVNQGGTITSTDNKLLNSTDPPTPAKLARRLVPLALGGDTRGFSVAQTFSTVGAIQEPGEPEPCGQDGGAAQWFVYTAPASGMMEVNTQGSTFNTILGVYTGPGTGFSSLVEAGCGYTTNYQTDGQPGVVLPEVAKGTTFYILVDGYQGASGVAQLQIGLGQPLTFRSLPPSQLITAGSNVTFNVTAVGSTPFSYQWQLNGINVPGATTATCKVINAQGGAEGNYTVIVSNALGAVTSSPPAALTLQYAPAIVSGPSNQTVPEGQPARFTVATLGVNVRTNPFVCQWYFSNAPLPKATSLSLSIPLTRLTNDGPYTLVISNTFGAVTSTPAMLTVLARPAPPSPSQLPSYSDSAESLFSAAAGTYSGLFYPADGATGASAGFLTATVASGATGAFSGNLLLDGGSHPFTGQFDASGDAQSIVPRAGNASVTACLHLDLDPPDGRMSGVISSAQWRSLLQAGRSVPGAAGNPGPVGAGEVTLIIPSSGSTPAGELTLANTAGATALVSGRLADGERILRAAPMVQGAGIPLYAPLYSGKGLFLGWITLTNPPGLTHYGNAFWIKPGASNPIGVLIVK